MKEKKNIAIILVCNVNRCCLFNTMIKLSKEKLIAKCSAWLIREKVTTGMNHVYINQRLHAARF